MACAVCVSAQAATKFPHQKLWQVQECVFVQSRVPLPGEPEAAGPQFCSGSAPAGGRRLSQSCGLPGTHIMSLCLDLSIEFLIFIIRYYILWQLSNFIPCPTMFSFDWSNNRNGSERNRRHRKNENSRRRESIPLRKKNIKRWSCFTVWFRCSGTRDWVVTVYTHT